MLIAAAALFTVGVILFTLVVRTDDLPAPEPVSPVKHLEERKATIYENLRDLQFEYRVGKLSEQDYQATKTDLQRELAVVLAQIDKLSPPPAAVSATPAPAPKASSQPAPAPSSANTCRHCGARFPKPMKFCGECGKSMEVEA